MPAFSRSGGVPVPEPSSPRPELQTQFIRDLLAIKLRINDEASSAVGMVESALAALWELDTASAAEVLRRDDRIDREEVAIEESAFRLMALHHPVASDFRALTFVIKVNADVERVADHACSVAKVVIRIGELAAGVEHGDVATHRHNPSSPPEWPTSLVELGQRVPITCHRMLRALIDEDEEAAKAIVAGDKTIDTLTRQLFDETVTLMETNAKSEALGLLVYRLGRELERIGDLMTNIAEDVVYLKTGEIIRHEKKRLRLKRGE